MRRSLLALATSLLGTSAFFALAILGAGGLAAFFRHPPLTALSVVTLALVVAGALSQGHLGSGEKEDRGNRWVLIPFAVLGLVSAYLPAYADRIGFLTFGGEGARWLGVVLYALGGALRIWPVFVLGRRFSGLVVIQPGHQLLTGGIYGVVRNPSYLGLLVNQLGWALAFRSWIGVALTVLWLPPLIARMRSEERFLRAHFGPEYEAYRARTARLIPGVY